MTRVFAQCNPWAYRVTLRSPRNVLECALLVTTYCRSHLFSADRLEKAISLCQTDNTPKPTTGVEQALDANTISGEERKATVPIKDHICKFTHTLKKQHTKFKSKEVLGWMRTGDAPVNVRQFGTSLRFRHHGRPGVWSKSLWSELPNSFLGFSLSLIEIMRRV